MRQFVWIVWIAALLLVPVHSVQARAQEPPRLVVNQVYTGQFMEGGNWIVFDGAEKDCINVWIYAETPLLTMSLNTEGTMLDSDFFSSTDGWTWGSFEPYELPKTGEYGIGLISQEAGGEFMLLVESQPGGCEAHSGLTQDTLTLNTTYVGYPFRPNALTIDLNAGESVNFYLEARGTGATVELTDAGTWESVTNWSATPADNDVINLPMSLTVPYTGSFTLWLNITDARGGYLLTASGGGTVADTGTDSAYTPSVPCMEEIFPEESGATVAWDESYVWSLFQGGTHCFEFLVYSDVFYSVGIETNTGTSILELQVVDYEGNVVYQSSTPQPTADGYFVYYSDIFVDDSISGGYDEYTYYVIVKALEPAYYTVHLYSHGGTLSGNEPRDYPPYVFAQSTTSSSGAAEQNEWLYDFSTFDGWMGPSSGDFVWDSAKGQLDWHVDRSRYELLALPLETPLSGDFVWEARVQATNWTNNADLWFGLAENLSDAGPANIPAGFHAQFGNFAGYNRVAPFITRSDGVVEFSWKDQDTSTYVFYDSNIWYRVRMEKTGLNWQLTVIDDASGSQVGQVSGVLSAEPEPFYYFILYSPNNGDWPTGDGLFDDISIQSVSSEADTSSSTDIPAGYAQVIHDQTSVRDGPGDDFTALYDLSAGDVGEITSVMPDYSWFFINVGGYPGFIRADSVIYNGDIYALPVWPNTTSTTVQTPTPDIPVEFYVNFSSIDNWIDNTGGDFFVDSSGTGLPSSRVLDWHVDSSRFELLALPISTPITGDVRWNARIKATNWTNNADLWFGLAENLDTDGLWAVPPGFHVQFGWFGGYNRIAPFLTYSDREDRVIWNDQDASTYAVYELDHWYAISFVIKGQSWTLTIFDIETSTVLRTFSGELPAHNPFHYFILYSPNNGDWPTGEGQFDELDLSTRPSNG